MSIFDEAPQEVLDMLDTYALNMLENPEAAFDTPEGAEMMQKGIDSTGAILDILVHTAGHANLDPLHLIYGFAMAIACELQEETGQEVDPDKVMTALLMTLRAQMIQNPEWLLNMEVFSDEDEGYWPQEADDE